MTHHRRQYRSGSRWAFWRWTDTPSGYITRLHLIQTPIGAVCLHWLNKPDPEPWLHDHPVSFMSIVLKGWYIEKRAREYGDMKHEGGVGSWYRSHFVDQWNFIRASENDRHTITSVAFGGCLTLCFMGPKVRDWGFHTDRGWEGWREYNKRVYGSGDSK